MGVDLYWLPLGAGGHFVRLNGRVYEWLAARRDRRPRAALYHSALVVDAPEGRFTIESAPIRAADGPERGVVAEGAVGSRWAGWLRIFRHFLRRRFHGRGSGNSFERRPYARHREGRIETGPDDRLKTTAETRLDDKGIGEQARERGEVRE